MREQFGDGFAIGDEIVIDEIDGAGNTGLLNATRTGFNNVALALLDAKANPNLADLGNWTPQQCVKFLMDNVGFDSENALAEVRRSFDGSVGPLYQCAYLMGALQFRALRHELVDSKKMTERDFHDAILHENAMPIELLRADLENLKLTRDYKSNWEYYGPHPTHP